MLNIVEFINKNGIPLVGASLKFGILPYEIIKMTMKTQQITILALLVVLSLQSQMDGIDDNYDNYKKQHGKKYSTS